MRSISILKWRSVENKLGFFNNVGPGAYLAKMGNRIGMFIGLMGRNVGGEDLVKGGITDFYVNSEKLALVEEEMVRKVEESPELEVGEMKRLWRNIRKMCGE